MSSYTRAQLLEAIAVAFEVCGSTTPSEGAAKVMLGALSEYDPAKVMTAIKRCMEEVRHRLSLADIIQRIPDGWLSADEAWTLCPVSEQVTTVWTNEIARAFDQAGQNGNDRIAQRMAFKGFYATEVQTAKNENRQPVYVKCLGLDKSGWAGPIKKAVEMGRLTRGEADSVLMLPSPEQDRTEAKQLVGAVMDKAKLRKMIAALPFMQDEGGIDKEKIRQQLRDGVQGTTGKEGGEG